MVSGWLKLHRELMEKPIWFQSTLQQKVILITLLMMASHEEKDYIFNGQKVHLMPGQFGTSIEKIVEKTNKQVTAQNVRTALTKFEKLEFLTSQSTKGGRLVTIVNWSIYQGSDIGDNKEANREVTNDQQTANKRLTNDLTPIKKKELKNEKKERNNKTYGDFFESIWTLYPIKKGKTSVSDTQKAKLYAIGYDEIKRAIDRYSKENAKTDLKYWKHGSTFFNSGYVDYLDANYSQDQPDGYYKNYDCEEGESL